MQLRHNMLLISNGQTSCLVGAPVSNHWFPLIGMHTKPSASRGSIHAPIPPVAERCMYLLSELPSLITPLPIYGLLLLALMAWRSGKLVWWFVLVWAYLMSIPALASLAGSFLENQYRPIADLDRYRGYSVVLLSSGSKRLDGGLGWVNQLTNSGWERLLVATETARTTGGGLVIAGGPPPRPGHEPISVTMKNVMSKMGIGLGEVAVETMSTNTYENLANLKGRLGDAPFILVTSATHLPRAMSVARKLGLNAVPQPADYVSSEIIGIRSFLPSLAAILHWQTILHEVVGLLYYKLRGYR